MIKGGMIMIPKSRCRRVRYRLTPEKKLTEKFSQALQFFKGVGSRNGGIISCEDNPNFS